MKTIKTTSLSQQEYRAVRAYSKSDLDLISKSPALIDWSINAPRSESTAASVGTLVHMALLEPDEFSKIKVIPEGVSAKERVNLLSANPNLIEQKVIQQVVEMRDSCIAHPVAKSLLSCDGESEVSIFSSINGLKAKCRPDRIPNHKEIGMHAIVDIKTTEDIDVFFKSVLKYRYHVQAAFYSDIYKNLCGEMPRFIFIVIGKKRSMGRYPVRVFDLPDDVIEDGRQLYKKDLQTAKDIHLFGHGFHIERLNFFN